MKTTGFNLPPLACAAFLLLRVTASIASAEESIPVPALHLDAGDFGSIVLGDDESVLEWGDAARFVPPGQPPRFVSDSINGRPAIRFGDGSFLVGSSAAASIANGVAGLTVVAIVKNEREGAQNIVRIGGGHSVAALRFMLGRRSSDWRLVARRTDQGDLQTLTGDRITSGDWTLVSGIVDFENARAALAIDGTEVAASDTFLDAGKATESDSLMFRIGNDHQEQYWQGSIAEILVYGRALSTAERHAAEMYLIDKYGLGDLQGAEGGEFGARGHFRVMPGDLPNDEGIFLNRGSTRDRDSYSTNAIIGRFDPRHPERLLIQSSIAYDQRGRRVNIHHWLVEVP